MKRKILILFFILFFVLTSSVFATNLDTLKVNSDIYSGDETYTLDSEVSGNVFTAASKFEMLDTAYVEGNLYVVCDTARLKSNVTYSNAISKDGSSSIESINSHATVRGNVFIVCNEFVLEPGSEINGDLYIVAKKIDIQKSSSVYGNLFAVGSEILLNGRVGNSVYATSADFTMNYYGAISKDLNVSAENVTLSSVIHRNACISSKMVTTNSDFLLYGNLEADAHEFNFSGEIDGDAKINSKKLNFVDYKDDENVDCLIAGNLAYSTEEEMQIGNEIVKGDVNYSKYIEKIDNESDFNFKSFIVNLITFVVYVLAIVLVFNLINKNYKDTTHEITVKNVFISLGIGLLSFLVVIFVAILLMLLQIGVTLSFALIFTYLFLLFMAIPIFVLDIALLLKDKYNLYLTTGLIALALCLVSKIPVLGGLVMFAFMSIGIGRVCNKVLLKKD